MRGPEVDCPGLRYTSDSWCEIDQSTRSLQFENIYFTGMCSGSEVGSYVRLIDFVYHTTLGLRVIKKKKV